MLWTQNNAAVVYPCHAVIVTLQIQTGEQRFFTGHTDKVSVTLLTKPCGSTVLVTLEVPLVPALLESL